MGRHCVLLNSVESRDGYGVDYVWLTTPVHLLFFKESTSASEMSPGAETFERNQPK